MVYWEPVSPFQLQGLRQFALSFLSGALSLHPFLSFRLSTKPARNAKLLGLMEIRGRSPQPKVYLCQGSSDVLIADVDADSASRVVYKSSFSP